MGFSIVHMGNVEIPAGVRMILGLSDLVNTSSLRISPGNLSGEIGVNIPGPIEPLNIGRVCLPWPT